MIAAESCCHAYPAHEHPVTGRDVHHEDAVLVRLDREVAAARREDDARCLRGVAGERRFTQKRDRSSIVLGPEVTLGEDTAEFTADEFYDPTEYQGSRLEGALRPGSYQACAAGRGKSCRTRGSPGSGP